MPTDWTFLASVYNPGYHNLVDSEIQRKENTKGN